MAQKVPIYGLMAEFERPEDLIAAVRRVREAGYRRYDAYSPYPVEGLAEAMKLGVTAVPLIVFIGGLAGGLSGFYMQYYASVIGYPMNVGGRPLDSWPAFIPITFELTVLVGGLFGFLGTLALNGLPMPYHPVFNVPGFAAASRNRFFLCIESRDRRFDRVRTRELLERLQALEVSEVEP
jgi:hypothetical protein